MIIFFLKKCVQKIGNQFHELNEYRKIEIRPVSRILAMIQIGQLFLNLDHFTLIDFMIQSYEILLMEPCF